MGNEYLPLFKNIPKEKRCHSPKSNFKAGTNPNKKIIQQPLYRKGKNEFIELLLYIKENNNLDKVIKAVEELNSIRTGYVNTERILFICEQSTSEGVRVYNSDETMYQSENNMRAYANMFNQMDEGVTNYG